MNIYIKLCLFVAFIIALGAFYIPYSLLMCKVVPTTDYTNTGTIGDTVGGTTAPFIGLAVGLLTFCAFWVQYVFNKTQNEQIEKQGKELNKERVETRFFELLKIHRENTYEISIKDSSKARRAFVSMFKEYKFCYLELEKKVKELHMDLSEEEIANISFIVFMYGIGETSNLIIEEIFKENYSILIEKYIDSLESQRKIWDYSSGTVPSNVKPVPYTGIGTIIFTDVVNAHKNLKLIIGFKPFSGHLSRLTHYFRHLYFIVNYVHTNTVIDAVEKENYINLIISQLSDYEMLLLYYYSLSVLGKHWVNNDQNCNYLLKYGIIKNIPVPLTKFGPNIGQEYKDDYFQWYQIAQSFVGKDT